ncbi:hypothetical protein Ddye_018209 [Dipteronia dyeriana]|uniref:MATH domain-containing protein n=1 Tax=Dipteronia dyeriana TaxID=168575 RepID=A0AAD9UAM2_9ROSI|nr:hypothetical protein Ddye_018209 [Dipteronia dyeriana]
MPNSDEISQEERDFPPAHFLLKIESYSLLSKAQGEKYESGIFDAAGYKWKLILYPNGNKKCDGDGHISLYLAIDQSNYFPNNNWSIRVNFKLFLLNQINGKHLYIQDAKGVVKRFDKLTTVWGFDQLLSLEKFNDPTNGYLVTTVVHLEQKFSLFNLILAKKKFFLWMLWLYPLGHGPAKRKALSLYLKLADWENFSPRRSVYAEFTMRILDHRGIKNVEKTVTDISETGKEGWVCTRSLITLVQIPVLFRFRLFFIILIEYWRKRRRALQVEDHCPQHVENFLAWYIHEQVNSHCFQEREPGSAG